MDCRNYYSVRMHASALGRHISGAERIVTPDKLDSVARELLSRALAKDRSPDHIVVTIDDLSGLIHRSLTALDVTTLNSSADPAAARADAARLLQATGVGADAVEKAFSLLSRGASPSGGNMRGAMIMDARTGERLEPDQERGVRASRFDWTGEAGEKMRTLLNEQGLVHERTYEALALASKIADSPGFISELCWSDDPEYTAGYVSSRLTGYVRFPCLKKEGDARGGRAVFIDRKKFDAAQFLSFMEEEAVLIERTGQCRPDTDVDHFLQRIGSDVRTGS
ncbi:MAG: 6-carboxyhexanoate--CoA ligase [Nitrospirae bacterium GWD2_57_9]|nr:MAG: 6-carboxyhexanoate--CoA ligase [Nitrospirae bacterium GWD2_57_9]